jgi:hypothetical protein
LVALGNRLQADIWVNMPHKATDEYVREFAQVVKTHLAAELRVYVEHSNEVWNWGFSQSHYALEQGKARWGQDVGDAFMQWHGMRTAQICDIFKTGVFGAEADRVRCVLGTQTGWRGLESPALECPKWAAEGNPPCHQHGIDLLGVTGYFSGCLTGFQQENIPTIRGWFDDPDGGIGRGLEQALDGRHFACGDTAQGNAETYAYFQDVATRYGLNIAVYEGGQHITANGSSVQDDPAFIAFHIGLNRAPGMKDVYRTNFENWRAAGGTLFMHFVDMGMPSKWGSWGALEHLGQETSPRWEAILAFNAEPCWWEGCAK